MCGERGQPDTYMGVGGWRGGAGIICAGARIMSVYNECVMQSEMSVRNMRRSKHINIRRVRPRYRKQFRHDSTPILFVCVNILC